MLHFVTFRVYLVSKSLSLPVVISIIIPAHLPVVRRRRLQSCSSLWHNPEEMCVPTLS